MKTEKHLRSNLFPLMARPRRLWGEFDVVDNRRYHTLSVPDNMISESLLVLIVPKPAWERSHRAVRSG
jgi:hypothetical protein